MNRGRGHVFQTRHNEQNPNLFCGDIQGMKLSSSNNRKIEGSCMEMCPQKELVLREREGLLHKFEIIETYQPELSSWPLQQAGNIGVANNVRGRGRGGGPGGRTRKPLPKADVEKTIKSFARSAAGQDKTSPGDLRPASVLKKTLQYLCNNILLRKDCPFNIVYDFVFDRLRAVRQDLVIQRIENEDAIIILEAVVKFHIYSHFRLSKEPISVYDPHINQKHLVDCLRKLLTLYGVNDYWKQSRSDFEALNCLIFMESYDVISRGLSIRSKINSKTFDSALNMCLSYQSKNYVLFFRRLSELPCIHQMYCVRYVPVMRSTAFKVICTAYGVNICKIPFEYLCKILLYRDSNSVHQELGQLSVEILRDDANSRKYAKFHKSKLDLISSKTDNLSIYFTSTPLQMISKDYSSDAISKLVCTI